MKTTILEQFNKHFKDTPNLYFAPGRVNLIGEHTDYNLGYVLPGAIDKGIYVAIKPSNSEFSRVYSINYNESIEINFNAPAPQNQWAKYIYGVVNEIRKFGHEVPTFDAVFGGNIPLGAGLSSSAALESVFALALNDIYNLGITQEDLAKIGQKTEHNHVGVNCGIMDQYACLFGKKDQLLKLDCRNLEHSLVPFQLTNYKVVLINTMVKHSLVSSEYNLRRAQCEEGVSIIASYIKGIESLRDVNLDMLKTYKDKMSEVVFKRCHYIVSENQRLTEGCEDLKNGHYELFGQKMFGTHDGLSKEFSVSCTELDFIAEIAKSTKGVIGARMMGGGFGGCVIHLIENEYCDSYIDKVCKLYNNEFNIDPAVIDVVISDGARRIME